MDPLGRNPQERRLEPDPKGGEEGQMRETLRR